MATENSVNFITMGYSFDVRFLGQTKKFDVSRSLFYQYVQDGKFELGAPIDVIYLPNDNKVLELRQMLGVLFYWLGGPIPTVFCGLIFLALSLIRFIP